MDTTTTDSQALPPGTHLHEFVIERVLGSGGFGITYLARDTSLGRQVVIKENLPTQFVWRETATGTVRPRHTSSGDTDDFEWSMKNFLREAETLATLDHPGIVRVLRKFEANGTAYFVMPFVQGVAFDQLITERQQKNQPFTEEELRGLLERMLDALGYLHDRGIYHRDIKPANLLITMDGIPTLIDFGSARQRLSERSMTVIESAGYTPFEQLQSRGNVGPWSDLYALAATIVKAITGEASPKANDRAFDDPWQPLAGRTKLAGQYSEVFLHSLDRGLRLVIEERWQTAHDWKQSLISGRVPEAKAVDRTAPSSHGADRERHGMGRRALVTVSALALLSVGGWWLLSGASNDEDPMVKTRTLGGLVLTSEPTGARVFDKAGADLGLTPFELKDLPSGQTWEGRMEIPGYETAHVVAEVPSGETRLVPPLQLVPDPQRVLVTSEPQGAQVVEDSIVIGTTPWEGAPRKVGSKLNLVLRKSGYTDVEVNGMVELGKTLTLQQALKAEPQKVIITSVPSGAEVVSDGRVVGRTPWESEKLPVATEVRYQLRLAEYGEAAIDGKISMEKTLELTVEMKRDEFHAKDVAGAERLALAEAGNAYAQALVGDAMFFGPTEGLDQTEITKRKAAGRAWIEKSATQHHPLGLAVKGNVLACEGAGEAQKEANHHYEQAVANGLLEKSESVDPCWWYYVGLAHHQGRGFTQDAIEAVKWFRKAAEQGNVLAQYILGVCYDNGNGVEKDARESARWYQKSAKQGDASAQYNIAVCYFNGDGVAQDVREAIKWYRKAAEQGNASAQYFLGQCFDSGNGVTRNAREAVKWYRKAAEQGDAGGIFNLGLCYANGTGVTKDEREAFKFFGTAAEAGNADAMINLGLCYYNGNGVNRDEREAYKWFRIAAEKGYAWGQYNLGLCYANGTGVIKDKREAFKWHRMAAEAGLAQGMDRLGLCYETGTGVTKDEAEAVKWYRKAAEAGNEQVAKSATENLQRLGK